MLNMVMRSKVQVVLEKFCRHWGVSDKLREKGWQVQACTMPEGAEDVAVLREGFSRDLASMLLVDLQAAVEHFAKNPPVSPKQPAPGFAH